MEVLQVCHLTIVLIRRAVNPERDGSGLRRCPCSHRGGRSPWASHSAWPTSQSCCESKEAGDTFTEGKVRYNAVNNSLSNITGLNETLLQLGNHPVTCSHCRSFLCLTAKRHVRQKAWPGSTFCQYYSI